MITLLLDMLKALPMNVLVDLFLNLAEELAKDSENKIDDTLVAALRVALDKTDLQE